MVKTVKKISAQTEVTTPKAPSGKQRVLAAAERLFASKGFLAVSAADIAREAGVAHGLLFHHFGSMEDLYAEVSQIAAEHMDDAQLGSFRGRTPREQIASFLSVHLRAVKQRQGDSLFRAGSQDVAVNNTVAKIWEASRQRAIDRICEVMAVGKPSNKVRVCLRGWLGFHDQLVLGWLADRSISQAEVLNWSLRQLDHLAEDVLEVNLNREID